MGAATEGKPRIGSHGGRNFRDGMIHGREPADGRDFEGDAYGGVSAL